MKKAVYYFIIVLEALALFTTIVLSFAFPVFFAHCWQMLLCVTVGIPLLALVCLGVEYRNRNFQLGLPFAKDYIVDYPALPDTKADKQEKMTEASSQSAAEQNVEENGEIIHEEEECLEIKWSKAMYQRYNNQWNELFDNIKRPLTLEVKAEISGLLWEIASQSIDFLKVSNSDLNTLTSNSEAVRMVIENLSADDIELEKMSKDPGSTDEKIIAIYEWLSEQGVKTDTIAFGCKLKF